MNVPRALRPVALVLLAGLATACGEKITLPEATGIRSSSSYIEQQAWMLDDPVDVAEEFGRIFVAEQGPGAVTKFDTQRQQLARTAGLRSPVAIAANTDRREILVLEAGDATGGPRLFALGVGGLEPGDARELSGLVRSVSGIAVDEAGDWVYISDPDSQVVHRFLRVDGPEMVRPYGVVAHSRGSRESPQFVFSPRGLVLDQQGMLLVCDADTTRNWVLRFDPTPSDAADSSSTGTATVFRSESCPTQPVSAFVLGDAPGCGETFEPGPSSEDGGLDRPAGVTIDTAGEYYVADLGNGRVQRFSVDGRFDTAIGDGGGGAEPLGEPVRLVTWLGETVRNGTTVTIHGARVYVVDRVGSRLRVWEDERWSEFEGG